MLKERFCISNEVFADSEIGDWGCDAGLIPYASETLICDKTLTFREKQIIVLIVFGFTNRKISKILSNKNNEQPLSYHTVRSHMHNINEKLDLGSKIEVAIAAVSRGWVDIPAILQAGYDLPVSRVEDLPPRGKEVLAMMAEGDINKEIAAKLVIGYPTVRSHVAIILDKLEVENKTQAAVAYLCYQQPILHPEG